MVYLLRNDKVKNPYIIILKFNETSRTTNIWVLKAVVSCCLEGSTTFSLFESAEKKKKRKKKNRVYIRSRHVKKKDIGSKRKLREQS